MKSTPWSERYAKRSNPPMTLTQHNEAARGLHAADLLLQEIANGEGNSQFGRYRTTSWQYKALLKTMKAITALRFALEDEVADLFPPGEQCQAIVVYWTQFNTERTDNG